MKYKEVYLLSKREYLGLFDGEDVWQFVEHIVGIKCEDNKIMDYKTNSRYDFIDRNEVGQIIAKRSDVIEGKIYAVTSCVNPFKKNIYYSDREIESYIKTSELFSEEYKQIGNEKRGKVLKK